MMRFVARHGEHLALATLLVLACLLTVLWIARDTRPQPGADPNTYLINTYQLLDRLQAPGNGGLWRSIAGASIQGRPPLYQVLAVPFILFAGRSDDVALALNVLCLAILILATYGMGRVAWNGKAGLLAAFVVTTFPPIVDLSTIYRAHAGLPACVAVSVWLLLLLLKNRSVKVAWLLGVSLGFGMLMHPNFLYLMPLPAVLLSSYMALFQVPPRRPAGFRALPRWLLDKLRDRFVLFGLLPAGLVALGLAGAWYVPRSQDILALQQAVTAYWNDQAYGFAGVPRSFAWYALTAPGAISYVLAALLVLGLGVCAMLRRERPLALLVIFLCMYGGLSLRVGDYGWLHFVAVLPVAAVITAVGCLGISRIAPAGKFAHASIVLTMLCLAVAAFNFSVVEWGVQPWSRAIATALGAPLSSTTCAMRMNMAFCPNPAGQENWRMADILRTVLAEPECRSSVCNLVVVPKIQDTFNSVLFDNTLVRDFPQSRSHVRVSNADGWGGAPGDAEWVLADYLLYIPNWHGEDAPREVQIGNALTQFLASPSPGFAGLHQEIAAFELPDGMTARLLKRTKPATTDTAISSYEEAIIRVPVDYMLREKLGFAYLRTGNWARAEELFRQASQIDPSQGWPYRALGYLYQKQGLAGQAVAAFEQAIASEPYDPGAYHSVADQFLARGDFGRAIDVYRLAAQRNPGFVWPLTQLGSLYVGANQLAEARAAFSTASRIEPRNSTARDKLKDPYWSPASSLGAGQAFAGAAPLEWWRGESWVRPYPSAPDVLVGPSDLAVDGRARADLIHIAPSSALEPTVFRFDVQDSHYGMLEISYGLADQVAGLSSGVGYTVTVSTDGGKTHRVLWHDIVSDKGWRSSIIPLDGYLGQGLTFALTVDALGDVGYDWLETAVRLYPPRKVWDLESNLSIVNASTDQAALSWSPSAGWVDGQGRQLVTGSQAPVQGMTRQGQVQFHPAGADRDTSITFSIADNPYTALMTSFALADEAVGHSDGVRYTVAISTDGKTYTNHLERDVTQNDWAAETIDLSDLLHQNVMIKLVSSSKGHDDYDWLQMTLNLLVQPGEPAGSAVSPLPE